MLDKPSIFICSTPNYRITIHDGIVGLKQYCNDNAFKLDIAYIQPRCTELVTWFFKERADVDAFKAGSFQTCAVTCPNPIWVYDPSACSCTCNVSNCSVPAQKIDYYNCNCAPTNGCDLTQDGDCNPVGKILDYANCMCKAKPS